MILTWVGVGMGFFELSDDLKNRSKILPVAIFFYYQLSHRVRREDLNPRYRALIYPVYLVMSTEFFLKQQGLAQFMAFASSHQILSFIIKIS